MGDPDATRSWYYPIYSNTCTEMTAADHLVEAAETTGR